MPLVTTLYGLPAFRKVFRLWRILTMPALVDLAALGTLEEVGWIDGHELVAIKSFHGLERLHTILGGRWPSLGFPESPIPP
ncbi:hypothetical protein AK812_SmicGene6932 [Symbiodinium microadriaticum]|uniref:Uncharacterized protein n=1 Tax=Symbiodinium microadriaticum TaxID=2951 RepID=A0A1Q9EPU7_SYMMI|nr:hypothetical protein AK812_SmicGene6932 [Symbiodinium microadriaticum]